MLRGALLLGAGFAALAAIGFAPPAGWRWPALLAVWAFFGAAGSMVLTPSGRVIRRSAPPEQLPQAFAAQFSLSHVAWLVTYPLAGWLGAASGLPVAAVVLGLVSVAAALAAVRLWQPARSVAPVSHIHRTTSPESREQLRRAS
jgi:MFS family permease